MMPEDRTTPEQPDRRSRIDKRPLEKRGRNAFTTQSRPPDRKLSATLHRRRMQRDAADKVAEAAEDGEGAPVTEAAPGAIPAIPTDTAPAATLVLDETISYQPSMPNAAVVALLDAYLERENRATAAMAFSFTYHTPNDIIIKVPIGYITDFASIPWQFRWLIEPFGRHARAAILHDWLYAVGQKSKKIEADWVLFDAMGDLGVHPFKRWAIFLAVLIGGWAGYGSQKEWDASWADWKTGQQTKPKHTRSEFDDHKWPNDPDLG